MILGKRKKFDIEMTQVFDNGDYGLRCEKKNSTVEASDIIDAFKKVKNIVDNRFGDSPTNLTEIRSVIKQGKYHVYFHTTREV